MSTTVKYVFQACIHMGNEDMGGGLDCVVRAVSTNDVLSCSTAKSTYILTSEYPLLQLGWH